MILIPRKEYQTLPPSSGMSLDDKEESIIKSLETLELTKEDIPLQKSLQEKNILTITTDPLKKGLKLKAAVLLLKANQQYQVVKKKTAQSLLNSLTVRPSSRKLFCQVKYNL